MGLAPYGEPKYKNLIKDNLIDIKDDGSFRLDQDFFNYSTGLTMTNEKFNNLFGENQETARMKNYSISYGYSFVNSELTEEVMLKMATSLREEYNLKKFMFSRRSSIQICSKWKNS